MQHKRLPEGISARHAKACPAREGGRCRCDPTYQAQVWSNAHGKRLSRTFPTLAAARTWRQDALVALRRRTLVPADAITLREAAQEWLEGATAGVIRNRSGDPYKPSVLRGYEQALRARVLPELGGARLGDIRRSDLQRLVTRMLAAGLDPSTVRNTLMPVRAIYRDATALERVAVNPTTGLHLPAVRGRRERIASPDEAARLIAALPARDRALWATAMYAGLRRGELRALDWSHLDLAAGLVRVERSWDPKGRSDPAEEPRGSPDRAGARDPARPPGRAPDADR